MNIDVSVEKNLPKIKIRSVKALVKEFLQFYDIECQEISIRFVSTATICRIHEEYFDDPAPTDCISFPMDEDDTSAYRILGEVIVCPETAIHYAKKHGGNAAQELALYVVHGLLHVIGYDDIKANDRKVMRKEEARFLKNCRCDIQSILSY